MNSILDKYFEILNFKNMPNFLNKYLNVPCLVRLKNVGYLCGMDYASKDIYDFKVKISRYYHSISVALITWNLTKDKKATLAGLFHDIATPCFSHVIDYMNKDYEMQESTEEYTSKILKGDKHLLELLNKDNINIDEIIDFKKYSIVDNDRPKLCADRLDGVILSGIAWTKSIEIKEIEKIINDITIYKNEFNENEIGFKSRDIAKRVLEVSDEIDLYCHSKEDNYMMELLAKITTLAIKNNIITYDDLYYIDEPYLMDKLENCSISEIKKLLIKFKTIKKDEIHLFELKNVKKKVLNPLVYCNRLM